MTSKVVKSTERGQITLPKNWRKNFDTDNFILEMHGNKLIIMPINIEEVAEEEVLFDADRDNSGKGISPEEIIKCLKKIKNG
ncbi:AbrB/MazE/SpoVT family DNA-binding domain-containing protein [Patescibacteria group bacterium]|nr:AbrB/MazE/SpoVT family DNA-binding domain-containing protein [Patescibacteria group bacterium]MBU1123227.1 AbrB/MazE/SpoVT family DNA-binding domain-containing protein [Patescibacteria group bacterium]